MRVASYIIMGIILIIYFFFNDYSTSRESINYILRSLYHANIEHLAINLFSFYNLSFLEDVFGSAQFLFMILFIWIVSSILLYLYHKIVPSRKVYTVGFSAVIFGLIVVFYFTMNLKQSETLTRLVLSIAPQLFMRGISWEGHICGVIAGFMYVSLYKFGLLKKK